MAKSSEQRVQTRTPCMQQVQFSLPESSPVNADILDISATGMGVITETKLQKGQVVSFLKNQPKWELPENALIVWSCCCESGYRAGLEFIA